MPRGDAGTSPQLRCWNGHRIEPGGNFCGVCGGPPAERTCPSGHHLDPGLRLCPQCGVPVGDTVAEPLPTPDPAPQEAAAADPLAAPSWHTAAAMPPAADGASVTASPKRRGARRRWSTLAAAVLVVVAAGTFVATRAHRSEAPPASELGTLSRYRYQTVSLPGYRYTCIMAVSSTGEVAGVANKSLGAVSTFFYGHVGHLHVFRLDFQGVPPQHDIAGSPSSCNGITGIGDGGEIVGFYRLRSGRSIGFVGRPGDGFRSVRTPAGVHPRPYSTYVNGIEPDGTLYGYYLDKAGLGGAAFIDKGGRFKTFRYQRSSSTSFVSGDASTLTGVGSLPSGGEINFVFHDGHASRVSMPRHAKGLRGFLMGIDDRGTLGVAWFKGQDYECAGYGALQNGSYYVMASPHLPGMHGAGCLMGVTPSGILAGVYVTNDGRFVSFIATPDR